jgi:hypothetical protein
MLFPVPGKKLGYMHDRTRTFTQRGSLRRRQQPAIATGPERGDIPQQVDRDCTIPAASHSSRRNHRGMAICTLAKRWPASASSPGSVNQDSCSDGPPGSGRIMVSPWCIPTPL